MKNISIPEKQKKTVFALSLSSVHCCYTFLSALLLLNCASFNKANGQTTASNAMLFVENLDGFPSNNDFVASRLQTPWSRNSVDYNANHDTLRIRLHNKGINSLTISNLLLSNKNNWKITRLETKPYDSASVLPLTIGSGNFADLQIAFVAVDTNLTRVKLILDQLTITSNDDKQPIKTLSLHGLWQREGEGSKEPRAQELINAFGFTTKVGFNASDPDKGANNKPKGDEVLTSYFVSADSSRPVTVRQIGAYHGCCHVLSETLRWYPKGATDSLKSIVFHIAKDAQTVLPHRSVDSTNAPSEGLFMPSTAFGFKVGSFDWTDTLLNPRRVIGVRVWKAVDGNGQIVPNAYFIANDYLGTETTNYDYNDNMYFVTNVRPELGPASTSALASTPSAVDFGEKLLQSNSTLSLNLQSLGGIYSNGLQDPALTISGVSIAGENADEFTASLPTKTVMNAGETTSLIIEFKPQTEGLKNADLLIQYDNADSPYRVPLYGIGKAVNSTVVVPYRIKSGSANNVVVNGKTWLADTPYAFDNLQSYTNPQLTQITATDEDALYLIGQSSNNDKKPFRYELPIANGTYWLRLHFAETYWGNSSAGLSGGAGSRVMSVAVEGEQRLINVDIAGEVGSAAALVKHLPVIVSDGKLNIDFSAVSYRPMVSAVEVYQFKSIADTTVTLPSSLIVYPNPLRQRKFTVNFPATYEGTVTLQLVDVPGRIYKLVDSDLGSGGGKLDVDVSKLNLSAGIYFLKIDSENGKTDIVKLLFL